MQQGMRGEPRRRPARGRIARALAGAAATAVLSAASTGLGGVASAQEAPTTPTTTAPPPTTLAPPSTPAPTSTVATTSAVAPASAAVPTSTVVAASGPATTAVPGASPAPTTASPTSTSAPIPATVVAPAPTVGPPSPPAYLTGKTMTVGAKGPAVLALEQRLAELRYDVGKVDGRFDWQTWQGVVAFQKVEYLPRTGRVTPDLQQDLVRAVKPGSLVPNGGRDHIEVDISRQVLFLFKNHELFKTVSVSTGSGRKYCEISKKTGKQNCGEAVTPRGNFRVQRRISGWRESDLGQLYNPLYFNGGFAIHGAPSVPASPASHGCVRIPMPTAEWFPDVVSNGTPVYVFD